jgi:hypothetical protein
MSAEELRLDEISAQAEALLRPAPMSALVSTLAGDYGVPLDREPATGLEHIGVFSLSYPAPRSSRSSP